MQVTCSNSSTGVYKILVALEVSYLKSLFEIFKIHMKLVFFFECFLR